MKRGKKLTRSQKEFLRKQHINPDEYSFLSECLDDTGRPGSFFKIQHKQTGNIRIICRFGKKG